MSGIERKLAAILAADVVGYSTLMGQNEEATLRAFNGHLLAGIHSAKPQLPMLRRTLLDETLSCLITWDPGSWMDRRTHCRLSRTA